MTVKELIKELQKYPENSQVNLIWDKDAGSYQKITGVDGPDSEFKFVSINWRGSYPIDEP